ncbi:MAG: GspE/PulE family protein [candidate division WOR-3 bacterium]|nr:GspE/PulE family protein [Candidatus Omnitrophota bacterium]MCM8807068.1 GspE/PulE family protein [Candidatus Omnitrophota bacterium]
MPTKREIINIIQNVGLWDRKSIESALEEQERTGQPLREIFQGRGMLPFGEISPSFYFQLGIVQRELPLREIPPEVISILPPKVVKQHRIVPWEKREDTQTLIFVTDDPINILAADYFKKIAGIEGIKNVEIIVTFKEEIDQLLEKYYGQEEMEDLTAMLQEASSATIDLDLPNIEEVEEDEEALALQAPVVKIVNLIFVEALRRRASDIHLEPLEKKFRVRFRIDGVLYEIVSPPKRIEKAVIARIKLMSKMDIAEKRLPQDGRIMLDIGGRPIDFRVSTLPGIYGESVVLRILDKTRMLIGLDKLGFLPDDLEKWNRILQFTGGLVLVTGPTGSGKTTTLYASLQKLNTIDRKIMTVEEPVEYQIPGINQTPVNPEIGLTFANVLRAFLRQSPDVILVGEIRDKETADIALRAALTGHLVFSTLHTNDAPSAITRLIDLGMPPFLVASAVQGVMAQRLVRVLCPYCKEKIEPDEKLKRALKIKEGEEVNVCQPKGCNECGFTGFYGRIGIFEIFIMNDELRELTLKRVSASELREAAIKAGMRSMYEDGILKVKMGITTLDEVISVTGQEE